jgi:hypothetical protein
MNFKINFLNKVPLLLFCYSNYAISLPEITNDGVVHLQGELFYAPCTIDLNTHDQTIELGEFSSRDGKENQISAHRQIDIRLLKCIFKSVKGERANDEQYYQIAFELVGSHLPFTQQGRDGLIYPEIRDESGIEILLGEPVKSRRIDNSNVTLKYSIQLRNFGAQLMTDKYQSLLKFRMDYY